MTTQATTNRLTAGPLPQSSASETDDSPQDHRLARKLRERLWSASASAPAQLLIRAGWITAFSLCVKLAAMGKDIFVARSFGASAELDCFLVAFAIPMYIWGVVSQTFSCAFVPTLVRVYEHSGRTTAEALIRSTTAQIVTRLALLTLALAVAAPWILPLVGSGFDADERALATRLFRIMLWIVPLSGVSVYLGGILNCFKSFAIVALAPICMPIVMLVAVVVFVPNYGVEALAWSVVIAYSLELSLLCVGMWRRNFPLLPSWTRHTSDRDLRRQYGHLFVGAMLMSSSPLIDQSMASWFGVGSVSVLSYGNKLAAVLVGTISLGLGAVVFPHFSRLAAIGDVQAITKTVHWLIKAVSLITIPMTGLLIFFSRPIAALLFQRGAMTTETITSVAQVQSCYLLQLPAYIVGILGVHMLLALGGSRTISRIAATNLVVNVVANLVLLKLFGITGIALATSCLYLVSTALVYYHLRRKLRHLGNLAAGAQMPGQVTVRPASIPAQAENAISLFSDNSYNAAPLRLDAEGREANCERNSLMASGLASADQYDCLWDHFQAEQAELFDSSRTRVHYLASRVRQHGPVLNIGIGGGFLEQELVRVGTPVYTVDPSPRCVSLLQSKLGLTDEVRVGRAEQLPFDDGMFGAVVVAEVLEHLSDEILPLALAEIRRVLRPGGFVIGTVPAREQLTQQSAICPNCQNHFHRWGHYQSFDSNRMRSILEKMYQVDRIIERPIISWETLNWKGRASAAIKMALYLAGIHGGNENLIFKATKVAKASAARSTKKGAREVAA
jgi:putative peptidoglycan lipid II flippase